MTNQYKLIALFNKVKVFNSQQPVQDHNQSSFTQVEMLDYLGRGFDKLIKCIMQQRSEQADYLKLEQLVQKYQADIRYHIYIHENLRSCLSNVKSQLEQSERTRSKVIQHTKIMLADLKRENHKLHSQIKTLRIKIQNYQSTKFYEPYRIKNRRQRSNTQADQIFEKNTVRCNIQNTNISIKMKSKSISNYKTLFQKQKSLKKRGQQVKDRSNLV